MDSAVLLLAQWLSPGFPVGAFAYSQGLEQAIADGLVADADDLRDWLSDTLTHGAGRADAILIRAAAGAPDAGALARVDAIARAFSASLERQVETSDMGAAFGKTLAAVWNVPDRALCYPVAFGHACRAQKVPIDLAVATFLQAGLGNLVGAAQRLMPLGQTAAQGAIAALTPTCQRVAEDTRTTTLDDMATSSFAADIVSMRHETLQPRIFRS